MLLDMELLTVRPDLKLQGTEVVRVYVEQQLASQLSWADLLILDNFLSHQLAGVRDAL